MKSRLSIVMLMVAVLILCFAVTQVMAGEKGECKDKDTKLTIDQLPDAVADTLRQAAGNGTIDEIEKEDEDGVVTYSAEVTKDGKKFDVEIAADGKLLKAEEEKDDDKDDEGEH